MKNIILEKQVAKVSDSIETLKLKVELYSERIGRIKFQAQLLQVAFDNTQEELKKVHAEIKAVEKSKKAEQEE